MGRNFGVKAGGELKAKHSETNSSVEPLTCDIKCNNLHGRSRLPSEAVWYPMQSL